jgi:hypothetical protein
MIRSFALPFILALGLALPAVAQEARPPSLLLHGNYCGPGNNAPRPPIDALDAACARHDACTPSGALPSRACNLRLQHDAELIANDPRQPDDLRMTAGFVAAGAAMLSSVSGLASVPETVPATGAAARRRTAERRALSATNQGDGLDAP